MSETLDSTIRVSFFVTERRGQMVKGFYAYCPDVGLASTGTTRAEALASLADAIATHDRGDERTREWQNSSGAIRVRPSGHTGCGIVEMMHLYSENKSGCVIAYWEVRDVDGMPMAEIRGVHDRLATVSFDNPGVLLAAVQFGQKVADAIVRESSGDR